MDIKNGIVFNRMYVGKYIFENLGHEIINMYAADNGNHYLYLNATGNFEKSHKDKIGAMLLTKSYKQNIVEVVGLATGLEDVCGADQSLGRDYTCTKKNIQEEQEKYIKKEGISYGGASIIDIFNDAEQQSIFITYKAEKFYKPKKRLFIAFSVDFDEKNLPNDAELSVKLTQLNWAKTSLKQYLYPKDATNKDYKTILNLVNNSDLWKEDNTKVDSNVDIAKREISLIDICQIQNDENCFSNMLAYFMQQKQYRKLWTEFFKTIAITLDENYSVIREKFAKIEDNKISQEVHNGGRIDIFINDNNKKNVIVIENKIKSDINNISTDENNSNQLRRYYNYVNWLIQNDEYYKGITTHFLILTPNYNILEIEEEKNENQELLKPQMSDIYRIITYNELYTFLSEKKDVFNDDANFKAFYEAIKRHTNQNVNAYLYNEMEEKFIRRIREINEQKLE